MGEMDDIVREFLVESYENLDRLDRDLVVLEKDPSNLEVLASVFRTIHTIKGTSGFLGLPKLESLTHAGENLISRLRDRRLVLTSEVASGLLALVDAVRKILSRVEEGGEEGSEDYTAIAERLAQLQESSQSAAPVPSPSVAAPRTKSAGETPPAAPDDQEAQAACPPLGEMLVQAGHVTPQDIAGALKQQQDGDPRHIGEILVGQGSVAPDVVLQTLEEQREVRASAASERSIRVDVGLLDKLMNLVGELVLARNQILQCSTTHKDTAFLNTSQRLNLITTELQEGVMKTRMQPIGNIWSKFPRVVRDLALACGKQVRIEMEGRETDLDKTIIEAIKDPLTHLVRNVVDHGIEAPEARKALGKPPEGRLLLRAFHEGGHVNVEISDDGAGIDLARVKEKAVERGLIAREQAARLSVREALNLIFLPGLSTAAKVTNVSGRGVGMDVVKTNIEKIGGTVDIQTKPGEGTTFKIKIPLTLAIIPALIVTTGGDRYAIPQVSLLELVRLEGDQARKGIEKIQDAPVYRLRGHLLPLVYLNHELGMESCKAGGGDDAANIVVLQTDERQFGLVVDEINDTEEIVVKPLGKQLRGIRTFAGATIMGDGRVALILDVLGLAQKASVVSQTRDRTLVEHAIQARQAAEERESLLVFRTPGDGRMATPLSLVSRLEEFALASLERIGDQRVVQYRNGVLPLVPVSDVVPERRQRARGEARRDEVAPAKVQAVVFSGDGKQVGLLVDRILDIVDDRLEVKAGSRRPGTLGSAVVQGKVTELLDVARVMTASGPAQGAAPSLEARL